MIQSGFQGLTEGKQAEREGEREAEGGERERGTDLYDGKLQRCLEGWGELTALGLNTVAWRLYLFGLSRRLLAEEGRTAGICLFRAKKSISSLSLFSFVHFLVSSCGAD